MIGYWRGGEVVGSDVERAGSVLGAVTSDQTVSVNTRRVGVRHQLDLHPGVTHVVIDLMEHREKLLLNMIFWGEFYSENNQSQSLD